ncbi:hypothetical protein AGOR_G00237990 [Albula goreensis]|uniref:Uncharacterized protein n=1 Tax=Albula goreensis TaxID=1534307 RepID=A0A8T3CI46_9TELE|nr:hypothetical protein AGOR_G00237990 [Albula goreensis]
MSVQCAVHICAVAVLFSVALCSDTTPSVKDHQHVKELFVAVGSAVDLPCGDQGDVEVQWKRDGTPLTTGAILSISNVSMEDGGTYTCHNLKKDLLWTLSLRPGYPPAHPGIHCWSPSYPNKAMCSWSEGPEPLLPTNYTATYWIGRCHAVGQCGVGAPQEATVKYVCQPVPGLSRQCALENLQLFSLDPYLLNLTSTNPLGSVSTVFSFILEDIVKPDPPVNVRVTVGAARQLSVEWAPPPTWPNPTIFPLVYDVRYYHGSQESARRLNQYESERMVLKGLRPSSTYFVQVSARDQLVGQSSDWSQPVKATVPAQ